MKQDLFAFDAPAVPGVYIFRDGRKRPVYIGKAKCLRDRLASYRQRALPAKTMAMLQAARSVEWIVFKSELEALLAEAAMIRMYKPPYNIDLRDDKRFPLILVTDEPFPKAVKVRRARRGAGRHFGPYRTATANHLLEILSRRFRLRRCAGPLPRRERPCIDHDIGRCDAPCVGRILRDAYRAQVEEAVKFLSGDGRAIIRELREEMKRAAAEKEFEAAASIRDEIEAMEAKNRKQSAEHPGREDADAVGVIQDESVAVVIVLARRGGAVTERGQYVFDIPIETGLEEIVTRALIERVAAERLAAVVFVPEGIDPAALEEVLAASSPEVQPPKVRVPRRGPDARLLSLAEDNAREVHRVLSGARSDAARNAALLELQSLLELPQPPFSIEGFDIATFAGKDTVGSCVRFHDGAPWKSGYRHYRIRGRQDSDIDAMAEMLARRGRARDPLPRLLLIDGGMGQLIAARAALESVLPRPLPPILSLEKREELLRTSDGEVIRLPRNSPALRLLQHIRDEAHRFCGKYHRNIRDKTIK